MVDLESIIIIDTSLHWQSDTFIVIVLFCTSI